MREAGLAAGLAVLLLLGAGVARAEEGGPQPPCGNAGPAPAYAALGAPPLVEVWTTKVLPDPGLAHVRLHAGLPAEGLPAGSCLDWPPLPFWVALAARFRHEGGAESLLARFGAVSELVAVRYWAAARQRWEPLFEAAYAVDDPERRERRGDLALEELRSGRDLYAYQDPGGPVGGAVYRMQVREARPDRLVVEVENVTTARMAGLFPLRPGTLRFRYDLERLPGPEPVWGYYGLLGLATAPDSARTYVNRMAGLFRPVAGIPSDQEPPVWP